jgi:hypothetical protein
MFTFLGPLSVSAAVSKTSEHHFAHVCGSAYFPCISWNVFFPLLFKFPECTHFARSKLSSEYHIVTAEVGLQVLISQPAGGSNVSTAGKFMCSGCLGMFVLMAKFLWYGTIEHGRSHLTNIACCPNRPKLAAN